MIFQGGGGGPDPLPPSGSAHAQTISRADPENSVREVLTTSFFSSLFLFFQSSSYFTAGHTDLLREAIGPKGGVIGHGPPSTPKGVQLLLKWVRTRFCKETYSHLLFSRAREVQTPVPPAGSAHVPCLT